MNFISCIKWIKQGVAKQVPDHVQLEEDDSNDSEKEDELIKEDDNLLVVGHVEDDENTLDVYVYNENDSDMYIHHDIILKSPPLCIEWLNIPGASETSNVCAVGLMKPVIEIWDLDIINSVEPDIKLGRHKKKNPEKNYGHTDAVLSLAWNTELSHILCSGGVDNRALMWDLDNGKVATEITCFNDKVQNLCWNPHNACSLLAGCADGVLRNFDCRVYDEFEETNLNSPVESILWDTTNEHRCFVGTEDGRIRYLDWRKKNKPIFQFQAHSKEVTGLCVDRDHPKVLVSISTDECMKLWDISNEFNMLTSKDLKLEALHCIDVNPNYSYLAAVGGSSEKGGKTILKTVNMKELHSPQVEVEHQDSKILNPDPFPLFEVGMKKSKKIKPKKKFKKRANKM